MTFKWSTETCKNAQDHQPSGNANQKEDESETSPQLEWLSFKNYKTINVSKDMGDKILYFTAGWIVKEYNHYGTQSVNFSEI